MRIVSGAALFLFFGLSLFLPEGVGANPRGSPQDASLSASQRSRLLEIVGATRGDRGSRKPKGVGVLFTCPESNEQTAATKLLTKELKGEIYRVDLRKVAGKSLAETEKNLQQVFAAAQTHQSILFFEEADSLFGKRSEVRDSHDRFANAEANYLLHRIEKYRGVVILSAARKRDIDAAFTRRLRFVVEFC